MQTFLVLCALICSNVGLFIAPHNEIRYEIIHLFRQAFCPTYVCGKPLIHVGRGISEEEVHHGGSVPETLGDVSIRGLWEIQMEAIIGIRFGDANAKTWNP